MYFRAFLAVCPVSGTLRGVDLGALSLGPLGGNRTVTRCCIRLSAK